MNKIIVLYRSSTAAERYSSKIALNNQNSGMKLNEV